MTLPSIEILDPRGFELQEWADYVVSQLEGTGYTGQLDLPQDWRAWAVSIIASNPLVAQRNPPDPYAYGDDWQGWGIAFKRAVE